MASCPSVADIPRRAPRNRGAGERGPARQFGRDRRQETRRVRDRARGRPRRPVAHAARRHGRELSVDGPPEVRNFDQLEVGGAIDIIHHEVTVFESCIG